MRSFSLVASLLALVVCISASAADVAAEDIGTNCQSFGLHITFEASRAYDSPLYEGLMPTTIEMFQASDRRIDGPTKLDFAVPVIPADHPRIERQQVVPAGMTIATDYDLRRFRTNNSLSIYDSPLYDGLYPMTIEAFKRAKEPFTFCIAFNR